MKFSLILPTVDRVEELRRFLESLTMQRDAEFDVIVIDQNTDDRLVPLLNSYSTKFSIKHLRSARGLSRARNVGLPCITGDVVAFPDDDCWYPPGLLERVAAFFGEHPELDGVTGRPMGSSGAVWERWSTGYGILGRRDLLRRGISFTIFLRSHVAMAVGKFNESLGAGAGTLWDWGEESDYLLRAMERGFRIYDDSGVLVYHREPADPGSLERRIKAYTYATGTGYFLRTHNYPFTFLGYILLRNAAGMAFRLGTFRAGRALHHWAIIRGLINGYLRAPGEV